MAGPELTVDVSGNPRVEVYFDPADLPVGASTLRIYRFSEEREWLVRGGVDVAVGSAVLDWEVPFGTVSMYRAEVFDVSGVSMGFTDVSSVSVDVSDVWVHNPLVPTRGVSLGSLALLDGSFGSLSRPTVGQVVWGEGDVVGTWMGTRRRGVTGAPVAFAVEDIADADALQAMLGDYVTQQLGVLCIRTPPPVRVPRTFFAAVDDPREVSRDIEWGGSRTDFAFSATEVKPPYPGITTPLLTYGDMEIAFSTYSALSAAIPSYTASSRAYEYAGLAG